MNRYWDKPILVMGDDGKLATIRSAQDAAAFILDRWPGTLDEEMLRPLEKLIDVIDDGCCPEDARAAFLVAIHQFSRLHS
ncbi:DUF982 domain-containing protein [Ochrobactrum vermis]|uniref:DUF982 domain-containing protein n=1 Tax=Ochrobactrum vermis TaxID=1827297 RepID=A0ABU8PAL3_9HYPH|nr:DUF982 domain-containing protein [Ochrobactrum vermis]PQZ29785.1 hypothetical protein CQZ93_06145 [Ochrobactrum vermis]